MVFMSSDPERCACGVVRSGLDLKRVLAFPGRQFTVQLFCMHCGYRRQQIETRRCCWLRSCLVWCEVCVLLAQSRGMGVCGRGLLETALEGC